MKNEKQKQYLIINMESRG